MNSSQKRKDEHLETFIYYLFFIFLFKTRAVNRIKQFQDLQPDLKKKKSEMMIILNLTKICFPH